MKAMPRILNIWNHNVIVKFLGCKILFVDECRNRIVNESQFDRRKGLASFVPTIALKM